MNRFFYLTVCMICLSCVSQAQSPIVAISFPVEAKEVVVHGKTLKKAIVTGSIENIMRFTRITRVVKEKCDTLLVGGEDKKRIVNEYLSKITASSSIPPSCLSHPELCIYIEDPADFLTVLDSLKQSEGCSFDGICLSKDDVSVSAACGPFTYEISTSGELGLSVTNGNMTSTITTSFR